MISSQFSRMFSANSKLFGRLALHPKQFLSRGLATQYSGGGGYQNIPFKLGPHGERSGGHVPGTYNDLPVPKGDWLLDYKEKQGKRNRHLAVGVTWFIFTIYMVRKLVDFNAGIPPLDDDDLCQELIEQIEPEPKPEPATVICDCEDPNPNPKK